MSEVNGVDAFILVRKEYHSRKYYRSVDEEVIRRWEKHSYHIKIIYIDETTICPNSHLENCLDYIVNCNLNNGDILWAYKREHNKLVMQRLGFESIDDIWVLQIE